MRLIDAGREPSLEALTVPSVNNDVRRPLKSDFGFLQWAPGY